MIRRFKNERLPNISVTVDLLTTGIDVPEISNLVFIRRVRSRILFEQILATLRRILRRLDDEALAEWKTLSGGQTLRQFISSLDRTDPAGCREKPAARRNLLAFLDENRYRPKMQLISITQVMVL